MGRFEYSNFSALAKEKFAGLVVTWLSLEKQHKLFVSFAH